MAKGWKCGRCATNNGEGALNCSNCGLIRGGVVVPGSYTPASSGDTPSSSVGWAAISSVPGADPETEPSSNGDEAPGADAGQPPVAWDPPPATKPLWRRIPVGWILFGVLVFGGAIGGLIFNANRSDTGEIAKSGDLTVSDLRVGDCYDLKDPAADEVDQVTALPCSDEHEYEMFFVGEMPAGEFPGSEAFSSYVEDNCLPSFLAYIGRPYEDSELDIFWLEPSTEGWATGDRKVQCAVYHPRIHRLIGSLQGSDR